MKNRKKILRKFCVMVCTILMMSFMTVPALASDLESGAVVETTTDAPTDPIQVLNNLNGFVFGLLKAFGVLICAIGIVVFATSFNSHDAGQRIGGGMAILTGLLIFFAKEILILLGVS